MWFLRRRPSSVTSELPRKSVGNSWSLPSCSSRPSEADGKERRRHDDKSLDVKALERAWVSGLPQPALLCSDDGTSAAEAGEGCRPGVALRSDINPLPRTLDGRQRSPHWQGRLLIPWARRRPSDSSQAWGTYPPDIHERDVDALPGTLRRRAVHEHDEPPLPRSACVARRPSG